MEDIFCDFVQSNVNLRLIIELAAFIHKAFGILFTHESLDIVDRQKEMLTLTFFSNEDDKS
jgi:hypothetical protein